MDGTDYRYIDKLVTAINRLCDDLEEIHGIGEEESESDWITEISASGAKCIRRKKPEEYGHGIDVIREGEGVRLWQ